ncbi:ABC transporter ATP-binding protein [Candidatus Pelagisphaera phototrophica]|uniref:ABC transporter ATP-binding protein n=1 Tax=Candidatus Pelagisphaera phototrophica TaxID=2684113 RepID=UPI0024B794F8|nr:ATP-binding cassette domain-containing protein [Candidatus Pelagisphaera phototrophica]
MGSTVWSTIEMTSEMEGLNIQNLSFIEWEHLDLSVAESEVVCLLGDSGSGKSLLLRAIADLIVNEGEVSLWGKGRESFSPPEWRKRVGYLAAEVLWWEETVDLHFSKPLSREDLDKVNLPHDAGEWAPSRLSMGERQRLGILRMLDRSPEVLLLDEPTANLDENSSSVVEKVLLDYIGEESAPTLWVTHSKDQAGRLGHRILEMKNQSLKELDRAVLAK